MSCPRRSFGFPLIFISLVTATMLGGCATRRGTPSPTLSEIRPASSFREAVQRALKANLAGRAYDRGLLAYHREDDDALVAAANDLRQAGAQREAQRLLFSAAQRDEQPPTYSAAERAVAIASALDTQALSFKGVVREQMRARAASEYRSAQRLMPKFDSTNPILLNALGYFLAERGQTPQDFVEAERLTRRALQLFDGKLKQASASAKTPDDRRALDNWMSDATRAADELSRANTRDSLAWALFRQKRFEEAAREQEQAMRDAQKSSREVAQPMSPELHFHLGEIYRALKRDKDARRQYEAALRLDPDDPSRAALETLNQGAQPNP